MKSDFGVEHSSNVSARTPILLGHVRAKLHQLLHRRQHLFLHLLLHPVVHARRRLKRRLQNEDGYKTFSARTPIRQVSLSLTGRKLQAPPGAYAFELNSHCKSLLCSAQSLDSSPSSSAAAEADNRQSVRV
jgi:hypothetical protein